MKIVKRKHGVDISNDIRARAKLRREVERAKRALSSQHQARPGLPPARSLCGPKFCSQLVVEAAYTRNLKGAARLSHLAVAIRCCELDLHNLST